MFIVESLLAVALWYGTYRGAKAGMRGGRWLRQQVALQKMIILTQRGKVTAMEDVEHVFRKLFKEDEAIDLISKFRNHLNEKGLDPETFQPYTDQPEEEDQE